MTCNLAFKPKGNTCLSSIFHSNLNLDRIRQHCEVKILGMESNLVFLQSRSSAIIFATSVHNLNVRCNNFDAEKILAPGVNFVILLKARRCSFKSDFYLFNLYHHGNKTDMTINQKIIKELNGFRHFSKTLDEFDNLGIKGNSTKDLCQIKRELENFNGNH